MTALKLQLIEPQQNTETLREQLEAELNECTEANATGKNHVRNFMVANGIWHISELNYPLRKQFEALLQEKYSDNACRKYLLAYDRIKQYSISKELQIFTKGKHQNSQYRNEIFYLPYYPDSELNGQFLNIVKKEILIWDFTIDVAEVMKRQIFTILCDMVRTQRRRQSLTEKLSALLDVYHYCCDEAIEDIEQMELEQAQKFTTVSTHSYDKGIIEYCRKILFLQSEEIPWQAPVWYLERFHLQPERTDPSNPVRRISFLEVTNKRNRSILQKYFRYALGVTNLSIGNIRSEHNYVRNFLVWLNQPEDLDICSAATEQIDGYFKELQQKSLLAASYNDQVMAILHFFNFLLVRKYIERIPFSEDLYLKKEIPVHHNRSVEQEVAREILSKLYRFPEEIRLIYLHLWAVGLRISEICSLKGNAYYVQGRDAWIQVYQNKMRNYKRIPIPTALYKLMQVYLKKHQIKSDDYVFQNQKGGAYRSATFRWKMKECCRENNIQYGEYIFQCHDYRHTVATNFYDTGVSIQSVRDYLGHSYEEMTQQYLDHMPKKIDKANEEYFSQHKSLAAGLLKKGGDKKMSNRIYLKQLPAYQNLAEPYPQSVTKNPYYDLEQIPSATMREELTAFIHYRSTQVGISRVYSDRQDFNKLCRFLQTYGRRTKSLRDKKPETWIRQFKGWMLQEGIPLMEHGVQAYGSEYTFKARAISYLEKVLEFLEPEDNRPEQEKDVWKLEKLDIPIRFNPIKSCKTLVFTKILQPEIREEVKKGIYLNLQTEAIACVQKELTAVRRFSAYLNDSYPEVKSCSEIDREVLEDYLVYLKTEATETKHFHADLNRLRALLDSIGKVCEYPNLESLFLTRDIPPTPKAEFKAYSDGELKRLNAALVKLDEQAARLMIIHQMLGTRISDTMTLEPDCVYEKEGITIIRIRQMKTTTYEKPISEELAALIRKAISYTKKRYGDTPYIFVNDSDPTKALQYHTLQARVVSMLREENILDDHGEPFGFGTHMYRHTYGMKLTEMHLDDWTIAKLLGHSSVRNVQYYRKMSNQILADETRQIRHRQSQIILENLDGWEEEYAKIREDDRLEPADQ